MMKWLSEGFSHLVTPMRKSSSHIRTPECLRIADEFIKRLDSYLKGKIAQIRQRRIRGKTGSRSTLWSSPTSLCVAKERRMNVSVYMVNISKPGGKTTIDMHGYLLEVYRRYCRSKHVWYKSHIMTFFTVCKDNFIYMISCLTDGTCRSSLLMDTRK